MSSKNWRDYVIVPWLSYLFLVMVGRRSTGTQVLRTGGTMVPWYYVPGIPGRPDRACFMRTFSVSTHSQ